MNNLGYSYNSLDIAHERRADLYREADRQRLIAEAKGPGSVGIVRKRIGDALVGVGTRLQGAHNREKLADLVSASAALRTIR